MIGYDQNERLDDLICVEYNVSLYAAQCRNTLSVSVMNNWSTADRKVSLCPPLITELFQNVVFFFDLMCCSVPGMSE